MKRFKVDTKSILLDSAGNDVGQLRVMMEASSVNWTQEDLQLENTNITQQVIETPRDGVEDSIKDLMGKSVFVLIKVNVALYAKDAMSIVDYTNVHIQFEDVATKKTHRLTNDKNMMVLHWTVDDTLVHFLRHQTFMIHVNGPAPFCTKPTVDAHEALWKEFQALQEQMKNNTTNDNDTLEKQKLQQRLAELELELKNHPKSKVCVVL